MWYRELQAEALFEDFPESVYTPDGIASLFAIADDVAHLDRVRSLVQERVGLPLPEEITTWFDTDGIEDDRDWWARLTLLHEVEHAARAAAVLLKHETAFRRWRPLRVRLQAFVAHSASRIGTWRDTWTFARVAEEACALDQAEILPWKLIATKGPRLTAGDITNEVIDLWLQEVLHESDERAIAAWLSRNTRLRNRYKGLVNLPTAVGLPRSDSPVWHALLGVKAQPLWHGPLPHLGPGGYGELRQHQDSVTLTWSSDDGDRSTISCSDAEPALAWTDPVLGQLSVRLTPHPVDDAWVMQSAADEILAQAAGTHAADAQLVSTMLGQFIRVFKDLLVPAAHEDDAPTVELPLIRQAVAVRAAIETACARTPQLDAIGERFRLDANFAEGTGCVDRLAAEDYEAAITDAPTHRESWWTQRAIFDRLLPEEDFDTLLDAVRTDAAPTPRTRPAYVPASEPSPLRSEHELVFPDDPGAFYWEPGHVLLLVRRENGDGIVLGLRVSTDAHGDVFHRTPHLAALAKDAIRTAYRAVTRLTHNRMPKRWLSGHRIELLGADDAPPDLLDGDTLALPCALAFASLWLEKPLRRWIIAAGRLHDNEVDGIRVQPVEVNAKLRALCNRFPKIRDWVAILPEDHDGAAEPPPSVRVEPVGGVEQLSEALAVAGLEELQHAKFGPQFDDENNCRDELNQLRAEAEQPSLPAHAEDLWWDLGDRIRVIADRLERLSGPTDELVELARIQAADALRRAGAETIEFGALLEQLNAHRLPWYLEAEQRVAVLDRLIKARKTTSPEARSAAEAQVEALRTYADELRFEPALHGRIEGSIGTYFLHLRQPEQAISHSQRALDIYWGAEHARHQTAHAVIDLAKGLRLRGLQLDESRAKRSQLDDAQRNLTKVVNLELGRVRRRSRPQYERTLMWRDYTLGRVHLDLGEPKKALQALRAAEERARFADSWPLVGVLRSMVWAHKALAQPNDAEQALSRLDALGAQGLPAPLESVRREAHGPYRTDGEIF